MGDGIPAWVWLAGLSALALIAASQSKTVKKVAFGIGDRTEKVLASLASSFRPTAREFVNQARAEGYPVVLTDGTRTMAEQRRLYAQGRTAPGKIVTNADAGESPHNFGLSIDFAFGDALGKPTWPNDAPWATVAQIGKDLGLVWGGDFRSFTDRPHLETSNWRTIRNAWRQTGQADYAIV
jgi:peptidoglycan L-alanyl-D-glutamate endopeptidase CwlK